jgi:hypothetical protein
LSVGAVDLAIRDPIRSRTRRAYDTTDRAAAALVELRESVTHRPTDVFVPSGVQGVPDERYDTNKVSTATGLSVADNALQPSRTCAGSLR